MWLDHITSSRFILAARIERTLENYVHIQFASPHESVRAQDPCDPDATLHPLPGDHSVVAPPVPIPNTEVKRNRADGSVHEHARVGHRQGLYPLTPSSLRFWGFFYDETGRKSRHFGGCLVLR